MICKASLTPTSCLLLDAKYYDIITAQTKVGGSLQSNDQQKQDQKDPPFMPHLPSIGDIRKQYFYAEALKDHASQSTMIDVVFNALLFPLVDSSLQSLMYTNNNPISFLGEVSISTLSNRKPLMLLGIYLEELMKLYVDGKKLDQQWIQDLTRFWSEK